MKKFLMATAALTLMMTMTVLTSCTSDNDDNPVVVTDDKPFTYDSEIDNTVRPGDNFYRYALGKWLDSADPTPSLFQQIRENNQALLVKTLTTGNDPLLVLWSMMLCRTTAAAQPCSKSVCRCWSR